MAQFEQKEGRIQPGMVIVWSGEPGTIPPGWGVCDGQNGTPDFRDRLPKGVSNETTDPGSTGGQNSYTLSESQMPSHTHSATVQETNDHYHHRTSSNAYSGSTTNITSGTGGGLNTSYDGDHSHSITTEYTGSGSSVDNLPAYREAHYIMRL